MAVTVEELVLKITLGNEKTAAELKKINGQLKDLDRQAQKTSKGVEGFSATFAKLSVNVFAAVTAVKTVISSIEGITSSFFEASDSVTRLNQSLELSGSKTVDLTSKRFQNLATTLQDLGVVEDEVTLKLAKIGTASGQSANMVEKLINASANLSVAKEIPLESAFSTLLQTLKGNTKGIASFLPELIDLAKEAGKAGGAIEYVNSTLSGYAARNLETFAGKSAALKFQLGEVSETFGRLANEVFDFSGMMLKSIAKIKEFNDSLADNKDAIVDVGRTIKSYLLDIWPFVSAEIDTFIGVFQTAMALTARSVGSVATIFNGLTGADNKFGEQAIAFADSLHESAMKNLVAFGNIDTALSGLEEPFNKVAKSASQTAEEVKKAREELAKIKASMMTPEQVQAWDAIKAKVIELQKAEAESGKQGADLIRAKAAAAQKEIADLEKKLSLNRKLTDEQKTAIAAAKGAVSSGEQAALDKFHLDTLEQISAKNSEIEAATKSLGATKNDQIRFELDKQLELLDVIQQKIDLEDKASLAAIQAQKDLLKAGADKAIKKTGESDGYQQLEQVGTDVAEQIGGVFKTGALGMVGGAMSMVGLVVKAIDAMLDFLPNMINSIAGIFNKLTDFPETLFNAFQGLFDGVIRFVEQFIPKLIESVGKSLTQITKFIDGLVKAFVELFQKLPTLLRDMMNQLPELITNLVASLESALPEIMMSLIDFIIQDLPSLAAKFIEMIYIKIPMAIINGLVKAFKKIASKLKDLFTGKGFKIDTPKIDTKPIQDQFKKLSENSSRLFKVEDLLEAAKNPLAKVREDVSEAFKKGRDYLKEAWNWVKEKLLPLIWDSIVLPFKWALAAIEWTLTAIGTVLKAIFDAVIQAFMFVWETARSVFDVITKAFSAAWEVAKVIFDVIIQAFGAVWEALKVAVSAAFKFVQDLWNGLVSAVSSAFKFVQDLWNSIAGAVQIAFKFVKDLWDNLVNIVESAFKSPKALFEALKQTVELAFKFVKDLWDNLKGTVESAFKFVKDLWDNLSGIVQKAFSFVTTVFNSIGDLGGKIWQGLKDGLAGAGAIFSNLGSSIWESLKSGLSGIGNFVMDIFNRLNPANLFEKIFRVDMKGKGTVENALNVDLPFLNFAQGGMVPGQAKFMGDSLANDNILAMLSPGEAIIPRSRMNDPNIARIVQEIMDGTLKLPQFAFGKGRFKIGGTAGKILSSGEKAVQDIGAAGQVVIDQATGVAQGAGDWLGDVFNDLNPLKAFWETVEDKVFKDLLNNMFAGNAFASGGYVPGSTDTVPAMLTPGEFVMSRAGVNAAGMGLLNRLNSGQSAAGGGAVTVNFAINIDAKTTMDEGFIRGTLVPRMQEELKRASLDGKFVISQRGIR